jgi:hypothetical protein
VAEAGPPLPGMRVCRESEKSWGERACNLVSVEAGILSADHEGLVERPYAPDTVDVYEEIDDVADTIVLDHNYQGKDELNQFVSVVESGTDMLGVSANSRTMNSL